MKLKTILVAAAIGLLFTGIAADGKGFSSGGGSRGFSAPSRSYSAPSRSYSAPSRGFSAPSARPSPSRGFSAPSSKPVTAAPSFSRKSSSYDQRVNRQMSAQEYKARQTQIDQQRSSPTFSKYAGTRTYQPEQIRSTRSHYYEVHHYYSSPGWYYGHPYGSFSEAFMWAMVWNQVFAYNHWNDPSYQQWRHDAEIRAQSDEKLKAQMAALQQQVDQMKASGTPVDSSYLPPDTPPEVAFTQEVLVGKAAGHVGSSHQVLWAFFWAGIIVGFGWLAWFIFKPRRSMA